MYIGHIITIIVIRKNRVRERILKFLFFYLANKEIQCGKIPNCVYHFELSFSGFPKGDIFLMQEIFLIALLFGQCSDP